MLSPASCSVGIEPTGHTSKSSETSLGKLKSFPRGSNLLSLDMARHSASVGRPCHTRCYRIEGSPCRSGCLGGTRERTSVHCQSGSARAVDYAPPFTPHSGGSLRCAVDDELPGSVVVTVRIPPASTKILLKSLRVAAQGNVEIGRARYTGHFLPH